MKQLVFILSLLISMTSLFGMEENTTPFNLEVTSESSLKRTKIITPEIFHPKSLKDIAAGPAFISILNQPNLEEHLTLIPQELIEQYINKPIDNSGRSPIYYARSEHIPVLIKHGACIDLCDAVDDATVFDYCIDHGDCTAALQILSCADSESLKRLISIKALKKITHLCNHLNAVMTEEDKTQSAQSLKYIAQLATAEYMWWSEPPIEQITTLMTIWGNYSFRKFMKSPAMECNIVGRTPLHNTNSAQEIKELLDNGYDINVEDIWGNTPLSYHIQQGSLRCAVALLDAGAEIFKENCNKSLAIEYAIKLHYHVLFEKLLTEEAVQTLSSRDNPDYDSTPLDSWETTHNTHLSLLELAAECKNNVALNILLVKKVGNHECKERALYRALHAKNLVGVQLLLQEEDLNINANNISTTLLNKAIESFPAMVPHFLAQRNIDISLENEDGYNAWETAIELENFSCFEQIIAFAKDVNLRNSLKETALMIAIKNNFIPGITYLLAQRADCTLQDKLGRTALHFAGKYGNKETMQLLLSHINQHYDAYQQIELFKKQDKKGKTILMYAVSGTGRACQNSIRQLLAQPGIELDKQNRRGKNALEIAIQNLKAKAINLLLKAGCAFNSAGFFKLITAALSRAETISLSSGISTETNFENLTINSRKQQEKIITIISSLVQQGAPIDTVTDTDDTLLVTAIKNGKTEVVKHLISLGSDIHKKTKEGKTPLAIAEEQVIIKHNNYSALKNTPISNGPFGSRWDEINLLFHESKLKYAQEIVSMLTQKNSQ